MKKILLPVVALLCFIAFACKNADKKHDHPHSGDEPKTLTDSLLKDIEDGHILGMSKIGKLHTTKKQVQAVIDSFSKLPVAAQKFAEPYIDQLGLAINGLDYADMAMDKWMMEYNEDSAKDNAGQHLLYLQNEKLKVDKLKEAILTSLQKADSLLKAKP